MRQNRLGPVPLPKKKEVEKKFARGEMETMFTDDKCVTVWRDNKPVYTASNSYSGVSSERVRRWNRQEREYIDLPIPHSVAKYNKGMGGVDLLDAMVAKYRGRVRRSKWWWPIFNWFVGVTAVNAWRLMRVNQDPDLPYLKFLRGLVMEVLSKHGKKKERTGFPVTVRGRAGDSLRRDAGHHMIVVSKMSRHCQHPRCIGRTIYECSRCNVGLHPACFASYHNL